MAPPFAQMFVTDPASIAGVVSIVAAVAIGSSRRGFATRTPDLRKLLVSKLAQDSLTLVMCVKNKWIHNRLPSLLTH